MTRSVLAGDCDTRIPSESNIFRCLMVERIAGVLGRTMSRLLVLEDDALLQTLLAMLLETAGYDVVTALPDEWSTACASSAPDIVVVGCDGRGTFEPGWRLAPLLRQALPGVVMIMLSTNVVAVQEVGRSTRGRLFDAGVRKPFSAGELLTTIKACHAAEARRPQAQPHGGDAGALVEYPL